MSTPGPSTSAQQRKVQWRIIDRALGRFSTESLLVLLNTALGSPGCSRFHDPLMLLWTRVLRAPERGGAGAGAGDLPGLVLAAVEAAPGRQGLTEREPNDPRALVRFTVAEERLLVHPGELDHPLRFLAQVETTARIVDGRVEAAFGFTVSDVLELVLRYSDHVVAHLAEGWPGVYEDREPDDIACGISPDELQPARALADLDLTVLAGACTRPDHAMRALTWLTRPVGDLPLRYHPQRPLLGPVLAVAAHGHRIPVPVSAALSTLATAVPLLLEALPASALEEAEELLQDLTLAQVSELLGIDRNEVPAGAGQACVISSPTHRYDIAVVSAIGDGALGKRVELGRAALSAQPAGRGRLVVYGGPRVLGPERIRDTLYLHVEELTEILADAEGDVALLALFVLEMSQHPGVDEVFYEQPMDAWVRWYSDGTLILPSRPSNDVILVPRLRFDPSWRRAAAWARVDDVLAAAGLPPSLRWRYLHLADPNPGTPGMHADLLHRTGDTVLLARIATVPPLAVVATPSTEPGSVLSVGALSGLADSVRITITSRKPIADHLALPDGSPVVIQLSETTQPHQPPEQEENQQAIGDEEDWLLLRVAFDPTTARIQIDLDPPLLTAFANDGKAGHRALGRALHHLVTQLRQARRAGSGTSWEDFAAAWNSAYPVLRLGLGDTGWPATAPEYTVPRTRHVQARALRAAAAAVRRAQVPTGSWTGTAAYHPGGQLLLALERELTRQIRSHRPALVEELARHLNAAWSTRTRGQHELTVNLAAPWASNWVGEVGPRQADAAAATSSLELLLQLAVANPPAGRQPVDVLAVAELVALAELVLHCSVIAVAASRRLHDLHLEIHDSGVFIINDTSEPEDEDAELAHLGFDGGAYQHARQQHFIWQSSRAEPGVIDPDVLFAGTGRTQLPYSPPHFPAGSQLENADRLLHQHWGCGLGALNAVMVSAADWPTPLAGIAATTAQDLVRDVVAWSALSVAEVSRAVERLLLHAGNAAVSEPHGYTEVERRVRPATHPLIAFGERILVLPWLVHHSNELWAAYLADGRLPHPPEVLSLPVTEALQRHRAQLDNRLETDVREAAQQAGLPHRFRLLKEQAAQLGIAGLSGEIDLLVADPAHGRLWVIEAKNPEHAVAPGALKQHIQRFTQRYGAKLLAKKATIAEHATAAAVACNVSIERDWRVLPLFVTRTVEPAAFVADPKAPFTIAEHLAEVLADPIDPAPGWIRPGDPTA